ncbi:vacuolar membrane protein-domain-containing protein [Pilobolus umbonatus]|nr:vacuolar membrane protein-domain-containing protein [Pilobolus umbonatus]
MDTLDIFIINNNIATTSKHGNSCELLDGFAILIQLTLALTALLILLYKRSKEYPKRSLLIWMLDTSKQFIGAVMIHFLNIGISYLVSKSGSDATSNLCVWYFLNIAIDTTIGVLILWCWYHTLIIVLEKLNIVIKTGEYGQPPLANIILSWLSQVLVFLMAQLLAKICLYEMLIRLPWLIKLGELCLGWTGDNYRCQVVFVMLIFPFIMNTVQFWVTDTILESNRSTKEDFTANDTSNKRPTRSFRSSTYLSAPMIAALVDQQERTPLLPPSKYSML